MTVDFPNIRNWTKCPFCLGDKPQGLVACWPCYREHDLRNGGGQQTLEVTEKAIVRCD